MARCHWFMQISTDLMVLGRGPRTMQQADDVTWQQPVTPTEPRCSSFASRGVPVPAACQNGAETGDTEL
jgi:hypothetical protein